MKRTPLYAHHRRLGARMVGFGGWEMPVQYTGITAEHTAVRGAVGLFDVSHMGEFRLTGPDAQAACARLLTNNIEQLSPGRAQYTALLNDSGGILDDLIVYMRGADEFFLCVNAGNTDSDFAWITDHLDGLTVHAHNESAHYGLLALQGPQSLEVLKQLTDDSAIHALRPFHLADASLAGVTTMVARTGYTGERGYELFAPAEAIGALWEAALDVGSAFAISPAGLGARDTLRLEMGYALHGHDITPETTPLEARLTWICHLSGGRFIGHDALARQQRDGVPRKLVGLTLQERGVAREGHMIVDGAGAAVGLVTSGTMSPTLRTPMALGYVPTTLTKPGTEVGIDIRGKIKRAHITKLPFYHPAR